MASEKKKLLMTMTGEIHQPVRLYYQVFDQAAVLHAFAKLRCLDEDQDNHRWVWLYHGEAKKLKFHTSYTAIPRKMRPIVLGAFRFTSAKDMTLDVRSCERATPAIPGQKSASNMLDQWNCGTMPLSL